VDLNGDGTISTTALTPADMNSTVPFYDEGQTPHNATPLFPRYLATPISPSNSLRQVGDFSANQVPVSDANGYLNVSSLVLYPVFIQVRWWSAAGFPREVSVFTFFTNRAGTTAPTDTNVIQ
jgi:hypothetical protein